jgi:WhiB family transcriptional regulator, redox-sensing transcriptional regulator
MHGAYVRLQEAIEKEGGVVCEQVPFVFFYDEEYETRVDERAKAKVAKDICAECPVKLLCLEYALESNETFGIWGGTTYKERKLMKRRSRGGLYQDHPWSAAG